MELEARARDEVPDCTGNEDFAGTSEIRDPCGGMHGYATNVIAPDLDLAGMEAAAHFDPKGPQSLDDRGGAAHAGSRTLFGATFLSTSPVPQARSRKAMFCSILCLSRSPARSEMRT
jgi:hypothetical protein